MKKSNKLIIAILAIFPLIGGFLLGLDCAKSPINKEIEANTASLIHNMCIIFDRHNLYDIDGSDEMAELLEARDNILYYYNW